MGASQEKKRRREERAEGTEKRQVQEQQRSQERKKRKKNIMIASIVVVIFALFVTIFSIPAVYAGRTALVVSGEPISVAEYNYYYYTLYYTYYEDIYNEYGTYYDFAMPDEDTLREETLTMIQSTVRLLQEAEANGFEETEDMHAEFDDMIEDTKSDAESANRTFNRYLKSMYGNVMTEDAFMDVSWDFYFATEYADSVYDSFEYSQEELDEYYEENRDRLDVVSFRVFEFVAEEVEDDPDTEEDETVDNETAMENARLAAEEFAGQVESERDFIDLAYEYASEDDKETYEDEDATLLNQSVVDIESAYVEWLMADGRQEGDVGVEIGNTGYYVVYFIGIDGNDYQTANIRMIYNLIDIVAPSNYETEEEYDAAVAENIETTRSDMEAILDEFDAGDRTGESFGALAETYDESNRTDPGAMIEYVYKYQYVDQINDWLFEEERNVGDIEMFHLENDGFYLVYFEGYGDIYRDYLADTALRNDDYEAFETELSESATSETTFWYKFTI